MLSVLEGDRRREDRRVAPPALRYPERRTGFDRRLPSTDRRARRFAETSIRVLRAEPWRLAVLLLMLMALGWLDLVFTLDALAAGAIEANPVMASLFAADVRLAAAVKLLVTGAVALGLWRLRGYRRILQASLLVLGVMLALIAYHIVARAVYA